MRPASRHDLSTLSLKLQAPWDSERIRSQLGPDSLHGASLSTTRRELGEGDSAVECILRGNRVRRFKDFDPMPAPRPTVRLL